MKAFAAPDWGRHHYVIRRTGEVRPETFYGDPLIAVLYAGVRENAPFLFNLLISARASRLIGWLVYDRPRAQIHSSDHLATLALRYGIDMDEILEPGQALSNPRAFFMRRIRYWDTRPMSADSDDIVSPADARMLVGSFKEQAALCIKNKFFDFEELLGTDKCQWRQAFDGGDFAVFRLTPDKYHYNHAPVSGVVLDIYEISGAYHSCNPGAVVRTISPYSKNTRVVTIVDTDVPSGSRVGLVAMIEVVALMIGKVEQCFSEHRYERPTPVTSGRFLTKGCPKSRYAPGSSTDILIFQEKRIQFSPDLLVNQQRSGPQTRYATTLGFNCLETDVAVRETIGRRVTTIQ